MGGEIESTIEKNVNLWVHMVLTMKMRHIHFPLVPFHYLHQNSHDTKNARVSWKKILHTTPTPHFFGSMYFLFYFNWKTPHQAMPPCLTFIPVSFFSLDSLSSFILTTRCCKKFISHFVCVCVCVLLSEDVYISS